MVGADTTSMSAKLITHAPVIFKQGHAHTLLMMTRYMIVGRHPRVCAGGNMGQGFAASPPAL